MPTIATRRFRVPLMWTVLDKAGNSNTDERIALMRRYLALFGAGSIQMLLADREFTGLKMAHLSRSKPHPLRDPSEGGPDRDHPGGAQPEPAVVADKVPGRAQIPRHTPEPG
jgi:hypothetical protein